MLRKVFWAISFFIILSSVGIIYYWRSTQPVKISSLESIPIQVIEKLPNKNKKIIEYIETRGKALAPSYEEVVCTDYVINVLSNFYKVSKQEKRDIQIITNEDLNRLLERDADVMKGVCNALLKSDRGIAVSRAEVQQGDFVQFWNVFGNSCYGHCGIVKSIDRQQITIYSSHPMTNGFGIHTFQFPDKACFVRLK